MTRVIYLRRACQVCVLLAVFAAEVSFESRAHALGGFLRQPHSIYSKLDYNYFSSKSFHTLDGTLRDRGQTFTQHIMGLYAEYGLFEHLTLTLNMPLVRVNNFANTEDVIGIGDLELSAKGGIVLAGFHLAGAFATSFPTGRSEAFAQLDDGSGRINLPTGDGEFNFWLRLGVSRSIPVIDSYASIETGVNLRTKGYSHQFMIAAEIGHHLLGVVWLTASLERLFSLGEVDAGQPFIYGNGTEYLRGRFGIAGKIYGPVGLSFDYSNAFAQLKNVYGGSTFTSGVFIDW